MSREPFLSVVATSRNDNHGKNLLYRMQMFVDSFIAQCKKHHLNAELILVEWNPPDDTPPLAKALCFPQDKGPCSIRIIRMPPEVHAKLTHADRLPLFQMMGKNVGIRRALGQFVLATNIDILFSDELVSYMKHQLNPHHLYRVDRLDVPETLPQADSFEEILKFCFKNHFRINGRLGTELVHKKRFKKKIAKLGQIIVKIEQIITRVEDRIAQDLKKLGLTNFFKVPYVIAKRLYFFLQTKILSAIEKTTTFFVNFPKTFKKAQIGAAAIPLLKELLCVLYPKNSIVLHTNACGDFTLLSRSNWEKLKGYPEWHMYSWHLDSVLLYQARLHGIKQRSLPRRMSIFHIEHDLGSGYSPEGAKLLFERLASKGIPYLSNADLEEIATKLSRSKVKVTYNPDNWGMADLVFEEVVI